MTQLFLLQRVNKQSKGVIEGSRKLRVKMFLQHSPEKVSAEELVGRVDEEAMVLWNPLMRISPSIHHEPIQLSTFRRFEFALMTGAISPGYSIGMLCPTPKIGPAPTEKRPQPALGGSWEKLKVTRVPLELSIQYRTEGEFFMMVEMFVLGKDATLGEFVGRLGAWYRNYFTEHMDQNSLLRRIEDEWSEGSMPLTRSSMFLPVKLNDSWN